ncbi:DNA polymerase III subunit gamma and tau [Cellulomonas sp. PhB150]|uniref:DNA polymerase III subunit gamma and tau n=1 Tax=Cellulomonas sp. PhB150 TaxID=2485188 RepID=UPI000F498608|nr:DNA polymerase III subunit gamma and tau [Cellulomonas sp. PhB150]ROS23604.1 DNA polymerase-3 subunit gamma/tau [Cellulomonas sp. PhB150]
MSQALYRRYRPENFAEVIGQDHVTAPLRQALRSGQVNHAYLFSGPRGCGKTTSARILARILNCAQNTEASPTDTPCGVCPSCVELARGGPGSLDVVEIDAASHGGVDDARELRERATFAPARDRYKIFILDEAHMVSPQGFNALLKIVEEPPPHIKFIFATTEPDKVIGTIRSRTHHYPFRLVPPDVLVPYLGQLCASEKVPVGSGVLPLVVRAGGGSVRDTLSVLDQLIAGAGEGGLEYEGAAALLGYTQASLLDDLVEAIAARDGASAFRVVDRVISTGHEPRRFVEDLLERLRDLIVIAASGDAADAALRDVPADQMQSMRAQASHLGAAELSRSADLSNAALTEMSGATSPRLHLELLMARLLLPAVDDDRAGVGARLDRLERGLPAAGASAPARPDAAPAVAAPAPVPAAPVPAATAPVAVPAERSREEVPGAEEPAVATPPVPEPAPARGGQPAVSTPAPAAATQAPAASTPVAPASAPAATTSAPAAAPAPAAPAPAAAAEPPASGGPDTEMLRRRWPEVLDTIKGLRRVTWALVDPRNAQVAELDATTLRLSFDTAALATTFRNGGHPDVVARAVRETLGFDVRVEGVLTEQSGGAAPARPGAQPGPQQPASDGGWGTPASSGNRAAGQSAIDRAAASWDEEPPPPPEPPAEDPALAEDPWATPRPAGEAQNPNGDARGDGSSARERGAAAAAAARPAAIEDDDPSPDDPDITSSNLVGAPLVAQMLGGTVIDEELDDPRG